MCLVQSYLLMATVIFLPYVNKAASWCRHRLVGGCPNTRDGTRPCGVPSPGLHAPSPVGKRAVMSMRAPQPQGLGQLLLLPCAQAPRSPQPTAWRSSLSTCRSLLARSGWRPSATGSMPSWPHSSFWTSGKRPHQAIPASWHHPLPEKEPTWGSAPSVQGVLCQQPHLSTAGAGGAGRAHRPVGRRASSRPISPCAVALHSPDPPLQAATGLISVVMFSLLSILSAAFQVSLPFQSPVPWSYLSVHSYFVKYVS